ncbi:dnaJ [Symbiodinium natans]|uniref:DnaJ protein n=1 Tax=Symbiodinium natans TaxID=878477 RepID=A0A812J8S5_9DINO|nr:dnaJ [Symbiodinium natans]
MLRTEVNKLAQELLMHRQVLEQCLEVRESVLELLQHREALVQCLELREGVQAALSSTQIIGEVVDRTSELDLSLAGVSDNTARHGRAIASLTEQQRRRALIL